MVKGQIVFGIDCANVNVYFEYHDDKIQINQCWLLDENSEETVDIATWVNNDSNAFESVCEMIKEESF